MYTQYCMVYKMKIGGCKLKDREVINRRQNFKELLNEKFPDQVE